MSQVITNAFEQYWQSSLAAEQPVVLDEFILADIPNLDITSPIDPDAGLPPESQIVHRQNVDQRGRINTNAVAYSIVMDTTLGDFSFNAMYLRNKANGVIGMIVYKGRETKLKTDQTTGQTGNSLVKSMLMGYDQAAEATLTHVDAGTWQIDYAARLRGQDEDLRQLASQLYGHHTFIGDGFKVVQQAGAHQVTPGVAIVGGLRVELKQTEVIYPGTKPIGVWVDVHRAGSLLSEHQNHVTIITSVVDLTDHVDGSGYQHYVAKLGTVQADSTVVDGRGQGGSSGTGGIPDTFALWKRSMAEEGYDLIGQFGSELTIENNKQVLLSKDGTEVYAWLGALPKDVLAESTPGNSGGVGPSEWSPLNASSLRGDLNSDLGFELVKTKPSGVAAAIKRALSEVIYDEVINVKWFASGLEPNWNTDTQLGNDYNAAIQSALNYFATLGTKRAGGKRAIRLPAGHYKLSALTIPAAMGFGIDFIGAGKNATVLWADPTNPNPAITSEIEFVNFKGMSLFGALSETSDIAKWKSCFYKGKLASNLSDIDVRFSDCIVGFATDFVQAYGRGVIFDAGTTAVRCLSLLNIVCDPSTIFTGAVNDTVYTGMRHYSFVGMRADVVSKLVRITGTAAQKDHIHGIQFVGCDLAACDRLIDGPDATIRGALITGNESLDSFAGGLVTVKSAVSCMDVSNQWRNQHSDAVVPAVQQDCIQWLWYATGAIAGLTINGVTAKCLSMGVVYAEGACSDIKIVNNHFPHFSTFPDGNANHWVFYSPLNCNGLIIGGNTFGTSNINGAYQLFNSAVQTSPRTRTYANVAPWSWADMRLRYTVNLLVNGVASATAPSSAFGRYWLDDQYVNVEFMVGINPAETTGTLSISLPPVTAIAESAAVTSSYGGDGILSRITGFSVAGAVVAPIQVNPATQEAELWRESSLLRSRMTAADKTGPISLFGSFKYRY